MTYRVTIQIAACDEDGDEQLVHDEMDTDLSREEVQDMLYSTADSIASHDIPLAWEG